MINRIITIKNSCGGQGCEAPHYTLPFGYGYEAFEIEAKFGKPKIKVPPVQKPKNSKGGKKK